MAARQTRAPSTQSQGTFLLHHISVSHILLCPHLATLLIALGNCQSSSSPIPPGPKAPTGSMPTVKKMKFLSDKATQVRKNLESFRKSVEHRPLQKPAVAANPHVFGADCHNLAQKQQAVVWIEAICGLRPPALCHNGDFAVGPLCQSREPVLQSGSQSALGLKWSLLCLLRACSRTSHFADLLPCRTRYRLQTLRLNSSDAPGRTRNALWTADLEVSHPETGEM